MVRLTDRPEMTKDVYRGHDATTTHLPLADCQCTVLSLLQF